MTQKPYPQKSPIDRYRTAIFEAEEAAEEASQQGEDSSVIAAKQYAADAAAYKIYEETQAEMERQASDTPSDAVVLVSMRMAVAGR
jgi:hypothetical protein